MAVNATRHLNSAPSPLQLAFAFTGHRGRAGRPATARRPYWDVVDMADLGGSLRARNQHVRVQLDAEPQAGMWVAYYDIGFSRSGAGGPTRPVSTRQDALAAAAHTVARYCHRVAAAPGEPRADVRAAKEVIRWLELLDLL